MDNHFSRLYEYNLWANGLFSEKLKEINCQDPYILKIYSHLHNAQIIWLNRIIGRDNRTGVWDVYRIEDCIKKTHDSSQEWLSFVQNSDSFDQTISYSDSAGNYHQSILSDICTHVANHSTHHRGQIATVLRQQNIAPPAADFIYFTRSK